MSSVTNYLSTTRNIRSLALDRSGDSVVDESFLEILDTPQGEVTLPPTASTCHRNMSCHQMCLDQIALASPTGSPPFEKMLHVLQSSSFFQIHIKDDIFSDVRNNIASMLSSWPLQRVQRVHKNRNETLHRTLHVDTVMSQSSICDATKSNCHDIPQVLIQTEQLYAIGDRFIPRLRACHESPLCVVWDFSDYHLDFYKTHGLSNSLMLVPIMAQKRLGSIRGPVTPLLNRTIDVAFFGAMTERRGNLSQTLKSELPNHRLEYSQNLNMDVMKSGYANARICLIVHAYQPVSAGELHRLSELGGFGCIPVVETWGDAFGLQHYKDCGDVVFSDYANLSRTIMQVLAPIHTTTEEDAQSSLEKRLEWWSDDIQWASVFPTIFDGLPRTNWEPFASEID